MCELGCGAGNITLRLAENGRDMIGIDLSADMLSEAKNKARLYRVWTCFFCCRI
ncbi:MAG: methyltransferase domain-containing protein [Veillonella parvula]